MMILIKVYLILLMISAFLSMILSPWYVCDEDGKKFHYNKVASPIGEHSLYIFLVLFTIGICIGAIFGFILLLTKIILL